MKLSLEGQPSGYQIRGYEAGCILIGNTRYETSLLLMDGYLDTAWGPSDCSTLTPAHMAAVTDLGPEIVILGTGEQQVFPSLHLMRELIDAGIGFEVMSTAAACRTYVILSAERRRVLGAFIP